MLSVYSQSTVTVKHQQAMTARFKVILQTVLLFLCRVQMLLKFDPPQAHSLKKEPNDDVKPQRVISCICAPSWLSWVQHILALCLAVLPQLYCSGSLGYYHFQP